MNRLTEEGAALVAHGQTGDDDEMLTHQKLLAEEGHLPAMVAMADLYYWGARGFSRDHAAARALYDAAAARGHTAAGCAAAGMWLKGEGGDANHTRAVAMYEVGS